MQIDVEQTVDDFIEHLEKTIFQFEQKRLASKGKKFYRNEWAYHNLDNQMVQSWLLEENPQLIKVMNSHPGQFEKLIDLIRDETEYQISIRPWKNNMDNKKNDKK